MAQQPSPALPIPDGYVVIYLATIRDRNGRIIHASSYGKRAFRLVVPASDID